MFNFRREEPNRLQNQRHNPYVGSFAHSLTLNTPQVVNNISAPSVRLDAILGSFRHSPSSSSSSLTLLFRRPRSNTTGQDGEGLRGILWDDDKTPHMSRLQLAREQKLYENHLSPAVLKTIPISKFSKQSGKIWEDSNDNLPQCAICLDSFVDGDELRTLPCSHIFHRKCVDTWLLGYLSHEGTQTNNCPKCRTIAATPNATPRTGEGSVEESAVAAPVVEAVSLTPSSSTSEIPVSSFLRMGQFLSDSIVTAVSSLTPPLSPLLTGVGSRSPLALGVPLDSSPAQPSEAASSLRSNATQRKRVVDSSRPPLLTRWDARVGGDPERNKNSNLPLDAIETSHPRMPPRIPPLPEVLRDWTERQQQSEESNELVLDDESWWNNVEVEEERDCSIVEVETRTKIDNGNGEQSWEEAANPVRGVVTSPCSFTLVSPTLGSPVEATPTAADSLGQSAYSDCGVPFR